MAFQPPRPWDELIKQLLGNVQNAAQATERGLQAQREERMVGEERAFQVERDETRRQWQLDDTAKQREYEQTDRANTMRVGWINRLQDALPYVNPNSDLYQQAMALLNALTEPSDLTGEEAYQNALRAQVVIAGQPVIGSTIVAQVERAKRERERTENYLDFLAEEALTFITNEEIDPQNRLDYVNSHLLGSGVFSDDLKDALLASAGVVNEDERRRIIQEGTMRDWTIRQMEVQWADAVFGLTQKQRLANLTYEEAQLKVEEGRQRLGLNDVEAFWRSGVVPADEARAQALAASLNMSPEALATTGMQRFRALQRREQLAEEGLRLANEASRSQIALQDVQTRQQELTYNRDLLYGDIAEKKNLSTWAVAAAMNGEVETVEMLLELALDPAYDDSDLASLDLERLLGIAQEIRGDQTQVRADARVQRDATRRQFVISARTDFEGSIDSIAEGFVDEDWTVGENGRRPVDDAIQEYVDGFTANDFKNMGVTANDFKAMLERAVLSAKVSRDRTTAAATLDMLLAGPIPEGEAERARWSQQVAELAEQVGLDEEAISVLASGKLDEATRELWRSNAEAAEINQRTDLLYQQTVGAWITNQLNLRAMNQAEEATSLVLSKDQYGEMVDAAQAAVNEWSKVLTSSACSLTTGDQEFTGQGFQVYTGGEVRGDPVCQAAAEGWSQAIRRLDVLSLAVPAGDGFMISPDALFGAMTTPTEGEATEGGEGQQGFDMEAVLDTPGLDWEGFQKMPEDVQRAIAYQLEQGLSAEDANLAIAVVQAEDAEVQRQTAALDELGSLSEIDVNSPEWYNLGFNEKTNRLARTREWAETAMAVLDGEIDLEDQGTVRALAQQFGWFARPTGVAPASMVWDAKLGRLVPMVAEPDIRGVDTSSFMTAMQATVASLRRQRDLADDPDSPLVQEYYRSPDSVTPRTPPPVEGGATEGGAAGGGAAPESQQPTTPPGMDFSTMPQPATPQGRGSPAFGPPQQPVQPAQPQQPPEGGKPASNMAMSQEGLNALTQHEGLRTTAYQDVGGVWTVGYGHTGPDVKPNMVITEQRARELLRADIETAASAVRQSVKVPLTQGQFDALTSFAFNIGAGGFRNSTVLQLLNQGDYDGAMQQLLQYDKARTGPNGELQQVPGLTSRRQAEAQMFYASIRPR